MLTPLGLWERLHSVGVKSVEAAVPRLEQRAGALLLAIANYRCGEGGDLLPVSRSVDDYCADVLTAGETAVQVGVLKSEKLQQIRSVVESFSVAMQHGRILSARPDWEPDSLFVGLDVDALPGLAIEQIRVGIEKFKGARDGTQYERS